MGRSSTVIRSAIDAGRHRLPFLFGLAALIFVPLGLLDALASEVGEVETDRLDDLRLLGAVAAASAHAASALIGEIVYAGAVAIALVSTPAGEDPSLGRVLRETRWRTLIAIDLLFAAGMVFSLVLLVVPAIFFFARYALCAVLAEIEDLGVRDSFRRSAQLSRHSRRLVFGLLFSAILLSDLATQAVTAVVDGLGVDHFVAEWVTSACGEVLLNPIFALLSVALALHLGARPAHPVAD